MQTLARSSFTRFLPVIGAAWLWVSPAHSLSCPINGGNPSCGGSTTSQASPNPSTGVGNPIDVTTGNKYQREDDIDIQGDLSIGFTRHYNSLPGQTGVLGTGWSHTYETRLSRKEARPAPGEQHAAAPHITIIESDGRVLEFQQFETTATLRRYRSMPAGYGLVEEDLGAVERLRGSIANHHESATEALAVWKWRWSDGRTLTFNGRGLLKTVERPDGHRLEMQFDMQRRFTRVTDSYGNWLAAEYWDNAADRLQAFTARQSTTNRGGGYRGRLKALTLSSGGRIQYEYDERGNLSDVVYADGSVKRYEYGSAGRHSLSKIFGRDGRLVASYEYDASGRATKSSHPDHRDDVSVSYHWRGPKQDIGLTTVEDAAGKKTTYTWRADPVTHNPVVLQADGPGCRTCAVGNVRYEYDSNGRVTKTVRVDAAGVPVEETTFSVDSLGRTRSTQLTRIVNGKPQAPEWQETREYTGSQLMPSLITRPSVVPGREHTLRVEYNERGQPTRIVEAGLQFTAAQGVLPVSLTPNSLQSAKIERTTVLSYTNVHGLSLLHSVDGPLAGPADTSTYRYDSAGRLQAIEHPAGVIERFERDTWGRVIAHTGLDGVRETLEYDADGNIHRFARGDQWMNLGYDAAGQIDKIADSLGQQLTLTRDDAGELVQIGDPAGNRIRWTYGDHGQVRELSLLNPDGSISQQGRPAAAHAVGPDPDAAIPNEAMLASIAAALPDDVGAQLQGLRNDPQPGMRRAGSADGEAQPARVLPAGLRTAFDSERRPTTYVYDDFGRLTAEHSPVSGTTHFRWDEADHLIERTAADDSVTRITRDALGRATRVRAGAEDGRIEWGAANRPTRVTFQAGEERFEYDAQARLTVHALLVGGKQFRISYEFDSLGRVLRKHLPDGGVLHYRYNGALHPKPGVLAGIDKEGLVDRPIVTDLNGPDERYADRGFTFGNGLSQHCVLDVDGRVLSDGNPKSGQSHLTYSHGAPAAAYTRTAQAGDVAVADVLPPFSARIAARVGEFGLASDDTMASPDARPYAVSAPRFDALGRLVEDGERRYEWNAMGRLTRVFKREDPGFVRTSFADGAADARRPIAEYQYNLFGERIAKLAKGPHGYELTYFMWDGAELAAEIDHTGKVLREYVYLDERPVALLSSRAIYAIHTDHRMAPVAVTDSNRRVVWQADVHDNGAADVLKGSTIELPLRASNQYFDVETGLHYNVYRYLDAQRGRYISPDPMGLAAGPDQYQFALGRPHAFVDPLGLQAAIPASTDISSESFGWKLTETFKLAAKTLPADVGAALLALVQPKALAGTVAVFALWGAAHWFGVGEVFDAVALAAMYVTLGAQAGEIIAGLLGAVAAINSAKCYSDLSTPAQTISKALGAGTAAVVQVAVLNKLFSSPKENVGSKGMEELEQDTNNGQSATLTNEQAILDVNAIVGKPLTGPVVSMPANASTTAIGNIGEEATATILQAETGATYQSIQNASNNGADLVYIDQATQTIVHVEVKSTTQSKTAAWPSGDLDKQFMNWVDEARTGFIAGKPVSTADENFAQQIYELLQPPNGTYKLQSKVMQVNLPPKGSTGPSSATLSNWPK
jgi:RHS repeat-associated protein